MSITWRELRSRFVRESFSTVPCEWPIFANRGKSPIYPESEKMKSRITGLLAKFQALTDLGREFPLDGKYKIIALLKKPEIMVYIKDNKVLTELLDYFLTHTKLEIVGSNCPQEMIDELIEIQETFYSNLELGTQENLDTGAEDLSIKKLTT